MIEKPKFLETERLRLRPIQLSDIPVVQKYSLDPEWHRFLDFHTFESVEDFVQKAVNSPWSEHARFSILFEGTMVGSVGLYIELKEKRAEIGYSLSKEYWGLGIIPEAVLRVINYGFQDLELEKISELEGMIENKEFYRKSIIDNIYKDANMSLVKTAKNLIKKHEKN